ncbi:hypothetical protein Pst134EA_011044 [Puccinia striiformis f. sp. tritici]|uniref:hypothetical protein n=1 Tax=Puccinia striiformis f. sp. tritici TaxID=168172 RepID=UPI0020075E70|nr:hypothetical protein Pst134EA_011044 [Puccinia striiformis f. sp. tritici]KAH9467398.1 hypothetical protein Pst134EA_011044 [Puccinia striiformis f. sp. tritici]
MGILDSYQSAPAWLKSVVVLTAVYLCFRIWSKILITRREVQAASWILNQRRRAGIPDSDKRPFKIAKAAVEATRNQSNPERATSPPLAAAVHKSAPQPQSSSRLTRTSTDKLATTRNPRDKPSPHSNHSKPTNTIDHSTQSHSRTSRTPEPNSRGRLSPKQAPAKPAHSTGKNKPNQPSIDKSNQKREAPISSDGSDPEQSETEAQRSASRNRKKKARTQNDPQRAKPATNTSQLANSELPNTEPINGQANQTNQNNGFKDVLRKKRILSDCVSEVDADQAMRIKKGRSEVNTIPDPERTPEPEDLMRVDEEESVQPNEAEEEEEEEENDGEKQSDQELYIIADDGRKKKLVKLRLGSPESVESQEENNFEQRWVTHKEFRSLKKDHKLLAEDNRWDSESIISSSEHDSDSNRLSTPSKQTAERGPIWSIEGKPRSNPILPLTELPLRIRPVSRPRNSLGRMRLSLPPDPASPSHLSRSRLISPFRPPIS